MAVLDDASRLLVRAALMRARNVGGVSKADLSAAVNATDSWIDSNSAAFNTALPEPFKSVASLNEKTILFCYVALKRAGLLPEGGI